MKIIPLFFFLLSLILSVFSQSEPQFQLQESITENFHLIKNQNISLYFNAYKSFQNSSIGFKYTTKNKENSLNIYLSERTPPSELNNDIMCLNIFNFEKPCIYNVKSFENEEIRKVYILLFCSSTSCEFEIQAGHIRIIEINNKTTFLEVFSGSQFGGIITFFKRKENTDIERVVLTMDFQNAEIFENFEYDKGVWDKRNYFSFTIGNPNIIFTDSRIIAIFNKTDLDFCSDCNFSMFITGRENSLIKIDVKEFRKDTELFLNNLYIDYFSGVDNQYFIRIPFEFRTFNRSNDSKLIFCLNSLTGSEKSLYLNGDQRPKLIKDFHFISTVHDYYNEEDIILTNNDLALKRINGDIFYLDVNAPSSGLFTVEVKYSDSKLMDLKLGVSEDRSILNDEIHYYRLRLWSHDTNVNLKLMSESGNADLYGRFCHADSVCDYISLNDMVHHKNIDFFSENHGFDQSNLTSSCPETNPDCFVLIAVRGYSLTSNVSRYSLLALRRNTVLTLMENIKQEAHIEKNEALKFKLIVHDKAESIIIKTTSDLSMFVAKDNKCFELNCAEKRGGPLNPIIYENETVGTYYITVQGQKSTNFEIICEVNRGKKDKNSLIALSEGKLIRDILTLTKQEAYFKVNVAYLIKETNLYVHIQGDKNKFELLVHNGVQFPDENSWFFRSNTNYLSLKYDPNSNYDTYFILVKSLNPLKEVDALPFSLMFSTDQTFKILEKNKVFYDNIKPSSYRYFMFFLDGNEEKVTLQTHALNLPYDSDKLEILIDNIPYHEEKTIFQYKFDLNSSSTIVLSTTTIKKICNFAHCPVYVSVLNHEAEEEISFSILLHLHLYAIQIYEGAEQRLNEDLDNELKTYFIPNSFESNVDFHIYSFSKKFDIFLSLFDDKNNYAFDHLYYLEFPNKTQFQTHSPLSNEHILSLSKDHFDFCRPKCVVLMDVVFLDVKQEKETYSNIVFLATADITELYEGRPISFNLENGNYKHFTISLKRLIEKYSNSSILISLTPFFGSGAILASISHPMKPERPDLKRYDYISYSDNLNLEIQTILVKTRKFYPDIEKLDNITLLIAVYGTSINSRFSINIMISKKSIHPINLGVPLEVNVKSNETQYFQFFNHVQEKIKILFNRENGFGTVSTHICKDMNFSDCKKKTEDHLQTITGMGSCIIELESKVLKDFCINCYFILVLRGSSDLKGTLLVSQKGDYISLQEGKTFFDRVDKKEYNLYKIAVSFERHAEILVKMYQGHVDLYFSDHYIYNINENNERLVKVSKGNNSFISLLIPPNYSSGSKIGPFSPLPIYINNYYFAICSSQKSEYTISFVNSAEQRLNGGVVHFDSLRSKEEKRYYYNNFDESLETILSINLENNEDLSDFEIYFLFRKQSKLFDYSQPKSPIQIKEKFKTHSSKSFSFLNLTGTFFINVFRKPSNNSNDANDIKYFSIVPNAREITLIPHDVVIKSFLTENRMRYYELFTPQKGFMLLNLLQCDGRLELLVTKDYHKLLDNDFDEEFKIISGQNFANVLKVEKGMVYLALKSGQDSSIYELQTHFYESHADIPQIKYELGGNGEIEYSFNFKDANFDIDFKPIECSDCGEEEKKRLQISYYLVYGENKYSLESQGRCGLLFDQHNLKNYHSNLILKQNLSVSEGLIKTQIENQFDGAFYIFIKAEIFDPLIQKSFTLFYPSIEIYSPFRFYKYRWIRYLITILIISIMVGCCCFGICVWKKYKIIRQKLKYEMQDVRNLANASNTGELNTSTSIEMENKKYVNLQEN